MKLSKIYSNKPEFIPIEFSNGLNIIIGGREEDITLDDGESNALEHNLGKTSLSFLIDFLLIKKSDSDGFIEKYSSHLSGWEFFLEIELNNGEFLTIKRGSDNPNKISFKSHTLKYQDFTKEAQWDEQDLSLGSTKIDPKDVFQNKYLGFNVCQNISFRHLLNYTIRTQNDYLDIFRLNLFRGADIDWKPQLFGMLGFDSSLIKRKYELEEEITALKSQLNQIGFSPKKDNLDEITALLRAKIFERDERNKKLKELDFFDNDKSTSDSAVDLILEKIANLNSEEYKINYNIQQILKTLSEGKSENIDLNSISTLFSEINIYFPDNLKNELEDVIKFSKKITAERNLYLAMELSSLEEKAKDISKELRELNQEWTLKVGRLMDNDKFSKYDSYRNEISRLDAEIITLNEKIENHKKYQEIKKQIDSSKDNLKDIVEQLGDIVNLRAPRNLNYESIQDMFTYINNRIFEGTAVLFMEQNKSGNIEFVSKIQGTTDIPSGQGDGYTAMRVQCTAFTLALLSTYSSSSFLRFAYLDGMLEVSGDKHKLRSIEIVREFCKKYNLQFILTVIRSDIPPSLKFEEGEVKRILWKGGGELFGKSF